MARVFVQTRSGMIEGGTMATATVRGEYVVLELHVPGTPALPAGVFLLDAGQDRLHVRVRSQWPSSLREVDREVAAGIAAELEARAETESGVALLCWLEDTFSHTLRLSERRAVLLGEAGSGPDASAQVARLFAREVEGKSAPTKAEAPLPEQGTATVIPFRTHLPYYPLRIAAGVFGGDAEAPDVQWVPVPEGLRPDPRHFVGRICGRSMEPRIPDGSFCLFRAQPQGSREGKLLLVQKHGVSESGGEFTIKRYHSEKEVLPAGMPEEYDDSLEWRHRRVRLISLNPAYPSWDLEADQCQVIAEFLRVLEESEVPAELRAAAESEDVAGR